MRSKRGVFSSLVAGRSETLRYRIYFIRHPHLPTNPSGFERNSCMHIDRSTRVVILPLRTTKDLTRRAQAKKNDARVGQDNESAREPENHTDAGDTRSPELLTTALPIQQTKLCSNSMQHAQNPTPIHGGTPMK